MRYACTAAAPASWRTPYAARSCNRQSLPSGLWRAAALTALLIASPQSASPPTQRTARRLPVGDTAECHSAIQVAWRGPLTRRSCFRDRGRGREVKWRAVFPRAALRLPWAGLPLPRWGGLRRAAPAAGRSVPAARRNYPPSFQPPAPSFEPHAPCPMPHPHACVYT
jgi:hypothetical protein